MENSIGQIIESFRSVDETLSALVDDYSNWLNDCREKNMSDEEILSEINEAWGTENRFETFEEADERIFNMRI